MVDGLACGVFFGEMRGSPARVLTAITRSFRALDCPLTLRINKKMVEEESSDVAMRR
jgi:hypothetical protein